MKIIANNVKTLFKVEDSEVDLGAVSAEGNFETFADISKGSKFSVASLFIKQSCKQRPILFGTISSLLAAVIVWLLSLLRCYL